MLLSNFAYGLGSYLRTLFDLVQNGRAHMGICYGYLNKI
jgi:hypothetical protein